jgi:hypothetical protein
MITQEDIDTLWKAYHLIEDEEHWTQGSMARASNGETIRAGDSRAVKFCMIGALDKFFAREVIFYKLGKYINTLRKIKNPKLKGIWLDNSIAGYNDYHTHPEMLNMFKGFIQFVEGEHNGQNS